MDADKLGNNDDIEAHWAIKVIFQNEESNLPNCILGISSCRDLL